MTVPARKTRFLQFNLRTFLILATVAGSGFGIVAAALEGFRSQQVALVPIVEGGGVVETRVGGSPFFATVFGNRRCQTVVRVDLRNAVNTHRFLERRVSFPDLRVLTVVGSSFGDAELAVLEIYPKLQSLILDSTTVSDAAVTSLSEERPELKVSKSRRFSYELISLIRASWPRAEDYNPATVIRVVNHLHSLGKTESLATLRRYAEAMPPAEEQGLTMIVPMLYLPRDPQARLPAPVEQFRLKDGMLVMGNEYQESRHGQSVSAASLYKLTDTEWTQFTDVRFVGELPFSVSDRSYNRNRNAPSPSREYLLRWAAEHADLRSQPFTPTPDPLRAATTVLDQLSFENDDSRNLVRTRLTIQVMRMTSHLIQNKVWHRASIVAEFPTEYAKLNLQWSSDRNQYVEGAAPD